MAAWDNWPYCRRNSSPFTLHKFSLLAMLIELQWKKARPFFGQDPSLSRNTSSVWLGPWKCPGCSRAAGDHPWSEHFEKYFVCSIGNPFAILFKVLLWGLLGLVGYEFITSVTMPGWNCWDVFLAQKGIISNLLSSISWHCHDTAFPAENE